MCSIVSEEVLEFYKISKEWIVFYRELCESCGTFRKLWDLLICFEIEQYHRVTFSKFIRTFLYDIFTKWTGLIVRHNF